MWNKKIRADLNLWSINLKFLQIVCHIVVYNMNKFWISSSQIEISTIFLFRGNSSAYLLDRGLHFDLCWFQVVSNWSEIAWRTILVFFILRTHLCRYIYNSFIYVQLSVSLHGHWTTLTAIFFIQKFKKSFQVQWTFPNFYKFQGPKLLNIISNWKFPMCIFWCVHKPFLVLK